MRTGTAQSLITASVETLLHVSGFIDCAFFPQQCPACNPNPEWRLDAPPREEERGEEAMGGAISPRKAETQLGGRDLKSLTRA